jgi:hypothetical protein
MAMHVNISTKVNAVCIAVNYHLEEICIAVNYHLEEIISIYFGTDQAIHHISGRRSFCLVIQAKEGM